MNRALLTLRSFAARAALVFSVGAVGIPLAPAAASERLDAFAKDWNLVNVGARVRIGGERVIGQEQPEAFREIDVSTNIRLPWAGYNAAGWGWSTRVLASVGWMTGKEDSALVVSVLPLLVYGTKDARFSFDAGFGGALLSRHRFAQQDFGGYGQFALTAGINLPLYKRAGIGYRFMHYSDAALHGTDTIGADFHMLEVTYRF